MGITAFKEEKEKRVLLSHEETLELISKAQMGDEYSKNKLIEYNLGLVRSVVSKFMNIGYDRDDLFQLGSIGLIKSIYKFDPQFNVKFSTYAVPMILGEIKRYLRDDGMIKVSRSLKQIAVKAKIEGESLSKKLGREPTIDEISKAIDVDKEDLLMALESNSSVEYLHGVIHEEEGSPIRLIDKISLSGECEEEKVVDNLLVKEMLGKLDKRERQIIMLRYFEDKTQSEIGEMLNISQVQVSRIEKKVLSKLKSYIE
jgi:RNA polymerase sporulation-specific sigma factor